MDHSSTLTLVQAGFGFGDLLIQAAIVGVAGLWVGVPFAVFGVRRRLDAICDAQRDHAEALTEELRRFRKVAVQAVAAQPAAAPAPKAAASTPARPRAISAA